MSYKNSTPTVLVISDSPEQFEQAASLFRASGFAVIFESDAAISLKNAGRQMPCLIISELAVHNIDGLAVCRRVRQDQSLAVTPVVLVGDLSPGSGIVADGFRCGASDYLQKPFDGNCLYQACTAIARRSTDKVDGLFFESFPNWKVDYSEMHFN